jgi:hypothetical protein
MLDKDKQGEIDRRKANLPLPDDPPGAQDLESANQRTTGMGSGQVSGSAGQDTEASSGLREPASAQSSARISGEEWKTKTVPGESGRKG